MPAHDNDRDRILHNLFHVARHFIHHLLLSSTLSLPPPARRSAEAPVHVLRAVYLACASAEHIRVQRILTKRDVYYLCPQLFPTVASVDISLRALSSLIDVQDTTDLNVVPAPKGLIAGRLSFTDEFGQVVHVCGFGSAGCLLPLRPSRVRRVSVAEGVTSVLVVEKETIFRELSLNETIQHGFILITGKGYPDVATCVFIRRLTEHCPGVPVHVLTDADPHGALIARTYTRACPRAEWIGAFATERVVPVCRRLELTERDRRLVVSQVRKGAGDEMRQFLTAGSKYELEALYPSLVQYILQRM